MVLREEMNQRMSNLNKRPDTVCADICQYIHGKGTELLLQLADYGVTAVLLTDLEKSIDEYVDYIPKPRAGIVEQKHATSTMRTLFKASDAVLSTMDALVTMVQFSDADFYNTYLYSRKIIRPGYRTISLKGTITDAEGLPISKANISIEDTRIARKTTEYGGFEVKDLASGMYAVLISKPGYTEVRTVVAVTATERTDFTAVLEVDASAERVA